MSQLVTFNSSSYNIPTTSEVGWSTTVTNFLADVGANALDKASTQTISGAKTFTGTINFTSATLAGLHTLGFTDNAIGPTLTLDSSNNVVIANNASVGGTFAVTGATTLAALSVTGAVTLTTALPVAQGGTAATTATTARTNLGVAIGTNVQAWDADLDTFAALSTASTNAGQSAVVASSGGWAIAGPVSGVKNKLINGDMRIDQRNVGAAITPTTTAYTLDRWQAALSATSKLTFQQSATSLTPRLPLAIKVTVAAQYTPGAGEIFVIRQAIEGVNILDLSYGSANAKTITVSFWVQSSITGLYNVFLGNAAATRAYTATFTIAVANTPQFVALTIPGDTTGTWAADVTAGLWIGISLGAGSTYTMAVGAWTAAAGYSGTGTVNFVSQVNGSTFYFSGMQAEIGSVATAFEQRLYGFELEMCQRYFRKSYPPAIAPGTAGATASEMINYSFSAAGWIMYVPLTPTMRASPTVTTYSPVTGTAVRARNDNLTADVATTNQTSETGVIIAATATGAQQQITVHFAADAEL